MAAPGAALSAGVHGGVRVPTARLHPGVEVLLREGDAVPSTLTVYPLLQPATLATEAPAVAAAAVSGADTTCVDTSTIDLAAGAGAVGPALPFVDVLATPPGPVVVNIGSWT